jgi:NCS1 family nucleobase:cation symporter-1
VSLVVSVIGTIALLAFIQSDSFAQDFDKWLVSVVVWIAAWGGVMLVDYYVVRRGKIDITGLYDDPARARYGDINWAAVIAAVVGLVAGWSWEYGLVEFMQGPIARATNNTDLSWLAAFVVSGALYYILRPLLAREEQPTEAPTPAA